MTYINILCIQINIIHNSHTIDNTYSFNNMYNLLILGIKAHLQNAERHYRQYLYIYFLDNYFFCKYTLSTEDRKNGQRILKIISEHRLVLQ